ncbi:TspO/MBR family protein [Silvibacterium sp.]|uniref:TspO/MBR family protein n=1 Tax=Silvibacterium sp. TaxID=1964179 RepID=UPI0039E6ECAC
MTEIQDQPTFTPRPRAGLALAGWLLLCLAVGGVSSIFPLHNIPTWYAGLIKPPLTPPNGVFGPVWTVLYILMGISAWMVWKTRPSICRRTGLRQFVIQLAFNFLWTWTFFSRHQMLTALVDIVILLLTIVLMIRTFRKMSVTAAWLLVPYLVWVAFATYLNVAFWRLNP